MIKVEKTESSDIIGFTYCPDTEELLVQFKGRRYWRYYHVPNYVAKKFEEAKSLGKYFNSHIRGQYLGASV